MDECDDGKSLIKKGKLIMSYIPDHGKMIVLCSGVCLANYPDDQTRRSNHFYSCPLSFLNCVGMDEGLLQTRDVGDERPAGNSNILIRN